MSKNYTYTNINVRVRASLKFLVWNIRWSALDSNNELFKSNAKNIKACFLFVHKTKTRKYIVNTDKTRNSLFALRAETYANHETKSTC